MANLYTRKKKELEILEMLLDYLNEKQEEEHLGETYEVVGKMDTQAKSWRDGSLLWEDEEQTIPKYNDRYDYVPHELTEEESFKLDAYNNIRSKLEKML